MSAIHSNDPGKHAAAICRFHGHCLFEKIATPAVVYESHDGGESFTITLFNQASEAVSGLSASEVEGKGPDVPFPGLSSSGILQGIQDCFLEKKDKSIGICEYKDENIHLWVDVRFFYIPDNKVLALYENVTDRQNMESRIQKSEKMEALGLLAGGIAHDFNNILSSIMGYGELSLYQPLEKDQLQEYIRHMMKAGERAKKLIRQILLFSRQDPEERASIFLKPILKEAGILLQASLPSSISLHIDYCKESQPVLVNPVGVHEVVMNLTINASHAMKEKGEIHLQTGEYTAEKPFTGLLGESPAGSYSLLKVADQGSGIRPDILPHIFEPYFTTKESLLGTGMGLAIVFGIMQNHQGNIHVSTEEGKGTEFTLFFPQKNLPESTDQRISEEKVNGHERLMVVDDEKDITDILSQFFHMLGFQVDSFNSSVKALQVFRDAPEKYDLVITDQTMPEMSGLEMSRFILEIRPDIPIVLCTGFSNLVDRNSALEAGIHAFYTKPLKIGAFAMDIRKILDER